MYSLGSRIYLNFHNTYNAISSKLNHGNSQWSLCLIKLFPWELRFVFFQISSQQQICVYKLLVHSFITLFKHYKPNYDFRMTTITQHYIQPKSRFMVKTNMILCTHQPPRMISFVSKHNQSASSIYSQIFVICLFFK